MYVRCLQIVSFNTDMTKIPERQLHEMFYTAGNDENSIKNSSIRPTNCDFLN